MAPTLVTGSSGMVGSAVVRLLGRKNLLTPSHAELDLQNESAVLEYFRKYRPRRVLMIAARVGGIIANSTDRAGFLADNLRIELNLFKACLETRPEKSLFLGSSCIYPVNAPQPIKEDALLTGPFEPTNEGYAIAKVAGLKMAQYLHEQYGLKTVCAMPCNIYGTGDSYDLRTSHVLSAMVKRFVDGATQKSPEVTLWGTGVAKREFIHVDDVAAAILHLMERVETPGIINVGTGTDLTIKELAEKVRDAAGYSGKIAWDASKPDGMPRKCLDVTKLANLGFKARIGLDEGIARTVSEYRANSPG